jgi:hypothetical protein
LQVCNKFETLGYLLITTYHQFQNLTLKTEKQERINMSSISFVLLAFLAATSAFSLNSRPNAYLSTIKSTNAPWSQFLLQAEKDDFEPEFKPEDPKVFDMNRLVRLGRSRDQVGGIYATLACFSFVDMSCT